jgi:hypothetical protein
MAQIKIKLPKTTFEKFSSLFESPKDAIDYLELQLDNLLRRQRKKIEEELQDYHQIEIEIYVVDHLVPVLEQYELEQRKPIKRILYKLMDKILR